MEIILFILSALSIILGIVGCVLPILPGPPLTYAGLLLLHVSQGSPLLDNTVLIVLGVGTVIVSLLDYAIPFIGAKMYGGTRYGIWGSVIGMLIGIFWFPPFGMLFGLFLGAFLGELIGDVRIAGAFKAGCGTLITSLFVFFLKCGLAAVCTVYYVTALIARFS